MGTLYAYVSKGLIRSEATPDPKSRAKQYYREDIERLKAKKELRREPAKAAGRALHWGMPLLESSITLIADNKLYYRGQEVIELATTKSIEQVAALIWECDQPIEKLFPSTPLSLPPAWRKMRSHLSSLPLIQQFSILLPLAEAEDISAYDLSPWTVAKTGGRIMRMMTAVTVGENRISGTIASNLIKGWNQASKDIEELVNAALVICADHELNASSFTARCVASAGSTPYAAVIAGLTALQGTKHGGHTEKVIALLDEIGKPSEIQRVISARLRRGEAISGFGHPLYPEGDPRGRALLDMVYAQFPRTKITTLVRSLETEVRESIDREPTIDLGLVALAGNLGLPHGGAITIFALGRTVGWIGHAIEQYGLQKMIRPRARYVGRMPEENMEL